MREMHSVEVESSGPTESAGRPGQKASNSGKQREGAEEGGGCDEMGEMHENGSDGVRYIGGDTAGGMARLSVDSSGCGEELTAVWTDNATAETVTVVSASDHVMEDYGPVP